MGKVMKGNKWKIYICRKLYSKPDLNRKLICLKRSFDEVCEILNHGGCCGKQKLVRNAGVYYENQSDGG